jgi:ring-1,2-phenylacetyl-CoA epoxidase subunit PaaE
MKQLRLTISSITVHPNDMVVFELIPDEPVNFIPGQFISIELMINGKPVRRSYSLCNSPYLDEPLTIAVKRIDNGEVSRALQDHYNVGDTITAYEPAGFFQYQYQTETPRDLLLIGAGSGITPLFSMLKSALLKEPQSTITLIYSNRSVETTLFYDELLKLQQQYPDRLNCIFLWSNSKNLGFARLNRDLLHTLISKHLKHPLADTLVYNCGPADYMLMVRLVLTGMGFSAEQLKKETFTLPEDEADDDDGTLANQVPVDQHTYTVILSYEGQQYQLAVPYTKSILDEALDHNIELPYSCKAGMCGTCSAQCTNGSVRMQYNEILTDRETANGRVLLCTAHPLGNDVMIEA